MSHANGPGPGPEKKAEETDDARNASYVNVKLPAATVGFLEEVESLGVTAVAGSLRKVHDWALYESDLIFDRDEKMALFHIKVLWEGLEQMAER